MKKIDRKNIILVDIQIFLTIVLLISFIMFLFNAEMRTIFQLCLEVTLLFMAYNNHVIYRKKFFTFLYLVAGSWIVVFEILRMVGIA